MNLRTLPTLTLLTLTLAPLLTGCGDPGSDLKAALGLDLSSTKGFVISPRLASSSSPLVQAANHQVTQALYAIDASGTLTEVQLTQDARSPIQPLAIHDTPKYVLFTYEGVTFKGKSCPLIPVRKSDGAMFCVERKPTGDSNQSYGNPSIQTDASGDLIFVLSDPPSGGPYHTLSRLDMAANPPTETVLIGDADAFQAYLMMISGRGDALVGTANTTSAPSLKVYPRTGDVQSLFGRTAGCFSRSVVGDDDNFVFAGLDASSQTGVYRLNRQGDGTFALSLYATSSAVDVHGCKAFVRTADHVFAHGAPPSSSFVELINPAGTPARRTIPGVPTTAELIPRGEYIYAFGNDIAGNGMVVRYRISDESVTTLLGGGEYRIGKLDISDSGDITFSGTRNSDGVPIIGNLSTGSTVVQVLTQNAPEVIQIARID